MSSRFVRPETVRLEISNGDWLLVKKHLTAGEVRRQWTSTMKAGGDGGAKVDPLKVGLSKMVAYLVDWSLTDADGKPVPIRGQSEDMVGSTLDMLLPDDFSEVLRAIETHEAAMDAARAEEKKILSGATKSDPILPSPESSDGDTNGSPNLIATSMAS